MRRLSLLDAPQQCHRHRAAVRFLNYYLQNRAIWYYAYPLLAFLCIALPPSAPGLRLSAHVCGTVHLIVLVFW